MASDLMLRERVVLEANKFAELVVWRVEPPVGGSSHVYKYRLALIVAGDCALRYGNERGKGDHVHCGEAQRRHEFSTPSKLLVDFWRDVRRELGQ